MRARLCLAFVAEDRMRGMRSGMLNWRFERLLSLQKTSG